ncbi:hypothetical protein D3C76_1364410 [compost metagenome]
MVLHLPAKPPNHAEVDKSQFAFPCHQQVAGMGVGMKEAALEDLPQQRVDQALRQLLAVVPQLIDRQ